MSQFHPTIVPELFRDKVILITGGANGIGASLVELCCQNGAYVCVGDVSVEAGEKLASQLCSASSSPPRATFQQTDVTDYKSLLNLFDAAIETYGHIDHAVSAAGITEIGNWFDQSLTIENVREPATTKVLEVNLVGTLHFTRLASVYLRHNRPENTDRSITLFSSVAGFKESPGLFVYQASKHGVLGLMRALRLYLPSTAHKLRINAVCPWMTTTGMVEGIQDAWLKAGVPTNSPMDVAKITAGLLADSTLNGKSMYVEGGRGWEIEESLDRLEPLWLGHEPSRSLGRGQEVLGQGMDWTK